MVITTDVILKGDIWRKAVTIYGDFLQNSINRRLNFNTFILSLSIGIVYDQRIESLEDQDESDDVNLPRTVLQNNTGVIDQLYRTAVLTTSTENFDDEKRLKLAFEDRENYTNDEVKFLVSFANFGVKKLVSLEGTTDLETMDNLKTFFTSIVEGSNYEIDNIPEEELEDMLDDYDSE